MIRRCPRPGCGGSMLHDFIDEPAYCFSCGRTEEMPREHEQPEPARPRHSTDPYRIKAVREMPAITRDVSGRTLPITGPGWSR